MRRPRLFDRLPRRDEGGAEGDEARRIVLQTLATRVAGSRQDELLAVEPPPDPVADGRRATGAKRRPAPSPAPGRSEASAY